MDLLSSILNDMDEYVRRNMEEPEDPIYIPSEYNDPELERKRFSYTSTANLPLNVTEVSFKKPKRIANNMQQDKYAVKVTLAEMQEKKERILQLQKEEKQKQQKQKIKLKGREAALKAARKMTKIESYRFAPSKNKKDVRSIEPTLADTQAKKRCRSIEPTLADTQAKKMCRSIEPTLADTQAKKRCRLQSQEEQKPQQQQEDKTTYNYKGRYAHLVGYMAALKAARKIETNVSYGCVPSKNKKDVRSIEQTMADIKAKKKSKLQLQEQQKQIQQQQQQLQQEQVSTNPSQNVKEALITSGPNPTIIQNVS